MNVQELIEKLSSMPMDANVFFDYDNGYDNDYFGCEVTGAHYKNESALITNWKSDDDEEI